MRDRYDAARCALRHGIGEYHHCRNYLRMTRFVALHNALTVSRETYGMFRWMRSRTPENWGTGE